MSIESWMEEFYPVEASRNGTDLDSLKHALLKFKGLLKENLDKHKVNISRGAVISSEDGGESPSFSFNNQTCSLCLSRMDHYRHVHCETCPISISGGRCGEDNSPYQVACMGGINESHDPEPMLELLQKLISERETLIKPLFGRNSNDKIIKKTTDN